MLTHICCTYKYCKTQNHRVTRNCTFTPAENLQATITGRPPGNDGFCWSTKHHKWTNTIGSVKWRDYRLVSAGFQVKTTKLLKRLVSVQSSLYDFLHPKNRNLHTTQWGLWIYNFKSKLKDCLSDGKRKKDHVQATAGPNSGLTRNSIHNIIIILSVFWVKVIISLLHFDRINATLAKILHDNL